MDYSPASQLIKKSEAIALALSPDATGDEIGSALALAAVLKRHGKRTGFFFSGAIEERWAPLLLEKTAEEAGKKKERKSEARLRNLIIAIDTKKTPVDEIKYEKKGDELYIIISPKAAPISKESIKTIEMEKPYDCIITIGITSPENFGREFEENPLLFYEKPIVTVDTSPQNESFGEINLVDMAKSSNAEIVFELIERFSENPLLPREATRLLVGIIEKTDNFKNAKTSPRALEIASRLMEAGADKDSIVRILYKTKPLNLLQFWGRASVRSRFDSETHILWTFLPREDFEATQTSTKDIRFILDQTLEYFKAPATHAVLFENPEKNHVRAILRSSQHFLKNLGEREEGEFTNGMFVLKRSFASFPEAEGYVNNLLRTTEV
ncbi:MAG: hypothetical protein A3H69_00405 [Candidatus Sungbacteria bacterium RIFCSPLOWO2_02_FULL_47_9]|uniref:DDH domain-containing protein n=1 Tax=Candidatus Sungbacteria bacterium RIFCSPHIGHO2_01_FULL_47_32 TaxID=1802264 RepID=A0A1G2K5J7_9BACT|nr:MAG: Exopolyphosphatase-related protein [Parcubacteria group bacterium GW2011_GWA2_47_10]OGZ93750.1 MAG: hypothetical protein A2633_02680 [Candidatus Sungbacteria bacterium RIFCSPHIGHO2_01_FULL_47_32]OHA00025.1 MAG: hypothetical protein A3D57_03810 [Candidatus Sungbacteria bacterium RIFCSPHIGHO2_02_FULL_46_12]OHA05123.1 MAG: hypothetical protein A3A28_00675 [Candidatus Sungbacteria bacterium RIFCSPLOWO2_01_FULL_47_32]OHA09795.1 MAG: hypothetical protein A3H69_00405 [Candidatus Sungbacteria b